MWFLLKWFFLTKCLCRYRMYFPGFERRCIDNDFALLTSWASWGEIARTLVSFERDSSCCEAAFSVHRGSVLQGQNHAVETQQSVGSIANRLPLDMLQRRLFVATNADHCGLHRPHDTPALGGRGIIRALYINWTVDTAGQQRGNIWRGYYAFGGAFRFMAQAIDRKHLVEFMNCKFRWCIMDGSLGLISSKML